MIHIAFAWPGFPDYGARAIAAVIAAGFAEVTVIGTKPSVPIEGMEQSLGQKVHWVDENDPALTWDGLSIGQPDLVFVGGWTTAAYNGLVAKCSEKGIPVVAMVDTCWKGSFRQRVLDPLRHRLLFRGRYDALFVPGASGVRYARHMGYPAQRIKTGLYGVDHSRFPLGRPMAKRKKEFIFAGQFIERKNPLGLARAFVRFAERHPEWTLRLCGSGPLKAEIPEHPRLILNDFVQPAGLSLLLQQSRALILPSLEEHWALVIHEAALSGCALALSEVHGSIPELARRENSLLYAAGSDAAIESTLEKLANWSDDQWEAARLKSHDLASAFGPERFCATVKDFAEQLVPGFERG